MSLKFFPLIFAILIGFIYLGVNHNANDDWKTIQGGIHAYKTVNIHGLFGIIASIPAIFFAFNGFYVPANLQKNMKEPKQLPKVMLIGIIIVTLIYILISLSIMFCSPSGGLDSVSGISQ
jgi:amino acid transporter